MATLLQAISEFVSNITPSDLQESVVQGAFDNLQRHLTNENCNLNIKEVFLNGSYIRGTMIRPLNDIDVFAVIDDSDYYVNGLQPNPQSVLTSFKTYLNNLPDYKDKCNQDRPCITIHLSKIDIDVMPALRHAGSLMIPNDSLNGWVFTDPKSHNMQFEDVDKRRNYKVREIVKAVKYWKREYDMPLPSFRTEEIAFQIFNLFDIPNLAEGIRLWFEYAEGYLNVGMTDTHPKYIKVSDAIRFVKSKLNEAKTYKDNGDEASAKRIWKEIFKSDFPIIDVNEARIFGAAIKDGSLKWSAATGLSTTIGKAIASSGGFYGEEADTED